MSQLLSLISGQGLLRSSRVPWLQRTEGKLPDQVANLSKFLTILVYLLERELNKTSTVQLYGSKG